MAAFKQLHPPLRAFIERQRLFFVATVAQGGRVNLSPKGLATLWVVGPRRIARRTDPWSLRDQGQSGHQATVGAKPTGLPFPQGRLADLLQ
ncbi:MAG: pyridoxamine 5'-phosphate oxidase family protein [Pseudomonadota bacterium]